MHGFLRNNSWETRVAAGQALEAIAKNVPQWAPTGAPKSGKGSDPRAAPKSGKGSDPRTAVWADCSGAMDNRELQELGENKQVLEKG